MFQMFEAKQLRDIASACERICVVWTLSDSEQTSLLCISQVQSPRAVATSEMLAVEVLVSNAGEERAARRAQGSFCTMRWWPSSGRVPSAGW